MRISKVLRVILIIIFILLVLLVLYVLFFPDSWDLETCNHECSQRNYNFGYCLWPDEAAQGDYSENLGNCVVENSKHCKYKDQCNCYCK